MNNQKRIEEIHYLFEARVCQSGMVSKEFYDTILKAIADLPNDLAEWVTEKVLFWSSQNQLDFAHAVLLSELEGYEGIVFLYDTLLKQSEKFQKNTILHEIAHVRLKHKLNQETPIAEKQENEANELVEKWLRKEGKIVDIH